MGLKSIENENSSKQNSENTLIKQQNQTLKELNIELKIKNQKIDQLTEDNQKKEKQLQEFKKDSWNADQTAKALKKELVLARSQVNELTQQNMDRVRKEDSIIRAVLIAEVVYSIIVTLFTAISKNAFLRDSGAFFVAIWKGISGAGKTVSRWLSGLISRTIPEIIGIVFIILIIALILFLIGRKFCPWWKEYCLDVCSLVFLQVTLAIVVWFGQPMKNLFWNVNLFALLLVAHISFWLIRWDNNRR